MCLPDVCLFAHITRTRQEWHWLLGCDRIVLSLSQSDSCLILIAGEEGALWSYQESYSHTGWSSVMTRSRLADGTDMSLLITSTMSYLFVNLAVNLATVEFGIVMRTFGALRPWMASIECPVVRAYLWGHYKLTLTVSGHYHRHLLILIYHFISQKPLW